MLLGVLKHVAEVCFSLPNPNSDFHWRLVFFLFALQSCQNFRSRADPTYHFPDPPLWSKFSCLRLPNVFVCYLSSDFHYWFSNLQTVWQDSCSKFHVCSLKIPCIWKCVGFYSKETFYFIYFWKQNSTQQNDWQFSDWDVKQRSSWRDWERMRCLKKLWIICWIYWKVF